MCAGHGVSTLNRFGIFPIDIMKLSGHKTEKEFLKYINVTKKQTAEKLILHPYFSGKQLSVVK